MKSYKTKEMKEIIFIYEDDFQVVSAAMLGYQMMMNAMHEIQERKLVDAIASIKPFNKEYLEMFKDSPDKQAKFIYNELVRIWQEPDVLELPEGEYNK